MIKEAMNTISTWIKHNRIFIVVIAIYVSYPFILYLSPHYSWFEIKRSLMAMGQVIVGLLEVPARLLVFQFRFGASGEMVVVFIYFLLAGLGVGKATQFLWGKGTTARISIVLAFLINGAIGLFILAWSDTPVTANPDQTCEHFISSENGLRIVEFDEIGILPGVHFFYLFTHNGGKTWEQLMTVQYGDPANPDCSTIAALDDGFIWIWSSYGVRTTKDNGKTWAEWDWKCCAYGTIEKVEFQNSTDGTMKIYPWRSQISQLFTSDGGKTWSLTK